MTKTQNLFNRRKLLAGVVSGTLLSGMTAPALAEDINVAASIRPLHSLVEMVLGDEGEAVLLVDGNMSPHNITLRPSDRLQLANADLVFLIDENFAPILAKTVDDAQRKVLMAEAEGLVKIKRRTSDYFGHGELDHDHDDHGHDDHGHDDHGHDDHGHDDHGHDDHGHDDHGHSHAFGEWDLHFWLDAKNAMAMVDLIENRLSARYPQHAEAFAQNKKAAQQKLQELDASIKTQIAPLSDIGLIVYHDAYTYFEDAYGITVKTTVLDHHDASSGVNRIQMIRHLVDHGEVTCLAHEPQFNDKILNTIDPRKKLTRIVMDPIGVSYPKGADQYRLMMQGLAESLSNCRQ